jgi:anthranilate synthase component 1
MPVAADTDAPAVEPELDRVRELAREANVIPLSYTFVDDCETPVSAFLKLRDAFPGPSFLLESAEQGRLGRYSFLGFLPRLELRWHEGTLREVRDGEASERSSDDPYGAVAETLGGFELAGGEELPPFAGGAVGFFGYDLVRTVEPLGAPNPDPLGLPDMALIVSELMLAFDHLRHEVTVLGYAFCDGASVEAAYDRAAGVIERAREALRGPVPPPRARPVVEAASAPGSLRPFAAPAAPGREAEEVPGNWVSDLSREHFEANVARIVEYVHADDACLTPIQHWLIDQELPAPHHFNMAYLFEAREPLDPSLLERAVRELLVHHDALRLRFAFEEGNWRQWISETETETPFGSYDFSTSSTSAGPPRRRAGW